MKCPNCQRDSIPFLKVWVKSDFGTFKCPDCGATAGVVRSVPLILGSISIGIMVFVLGVYFGSLIVFDVALVVGSVVDAAVTYRFRRLKVIGPNVRLRFLMT